MDVAATTQRLLIEACPIGQGNTLHPVTLVLPRCEGAERCRVFKRERVVVGRTAFHKILQTSSKCTRGLYCGDIERLVGADTCQQLHIHIYLYMFIKNIYT